MSLNKFHWQITDLSFQTICLVLNFVVLSRLLTEEDFAIFGVINLVYLFINRFQSSGMRMSLVHFKNREEYYSSIWYFNLLLSFIIFIISVFSLKFFLNYYSPFYTVYITEYSIFLIIIVFQSISSIRLVNIYRNKNLKKIFLFNTSFHLSKVLLTLIFAFYFNNYKAILYGNLLPVLIQSVFSYFLVPGKINFEFNLKKIKKVTSFSKWLLFKNIFGYLSNNGVSLLTAVYLQPTILGNIQRSNTLTSFFIIFTRNINKNFFYAIYEDNKNNKIKSSVLLITSINLLLNLFFLISFFLFFFGKDVIQFVMGPKWNNIHFILCNLLLYTLFEVINIFLSSYHRAIYGSKREFNAALIKALIMLPLLFLGLKFYNLDGLLLALLISAFISTNIELFRSISNWKTLISIQGKLLIFLTLGIIFSFSDILNLIFYNYYFKILSLLLLLINLVFSLKRNIKIWRNY